MSYETVPVTGRRDRGVRVAAVSVATPDVVLSQHQAIELIERYYVGELNPRILDLMRQFLSHESIRTRRVAVDSPGELPLLKDEPADHRIERFTRHAVTLCERAAKDALAKAGLGIADVAVIVVNTCTGYICPGLSTYLVERLGLPASVEAYDLVGAGCGGALPNILMGEASLSRHTEKAALCIAVEICSATYQMGNDPSLLLSNALFGDGAAAAVLWKQPEGLAITGSAARFEPRFRDDVRFVHKNGALHNQLSLRLPRIMREIAPPFIKAFLASGGVAVERIEHWALHPGGDRILSALAEELNLDTRACAASRSVLRDFGNMSSPSVLFVLERIIDAGIAPGERCCAVAYGAGLSLHALLLERI